MCLHVSMSIYEAVRVAAYIIISFGCHCQYYGRGRGKNSKAKQKAQATKKIKLNKCLSNCLVQ